MGVKIGAALRRLVGTDVERNPGADSPRAPSTDSAAAADSALRPSEVPSACEADSADPAEHARRLLHWLQADGGAVGEVLAKDVQGGYADMCAELAWAPITWLRVGREFGKITGPRRYRDVIQRGRRHRLLTYVIPRPGEVFASDEARNRHPAAPMPARLTAIESEIARLAETVGTLAAAVAAADRAAGAGRVDQSSVIHITDGRR